KNGLGITASANMIDDGKSHNFYQFTISPSFDYIKDRKLATGISYTKYITKDALPFYTSPLQNEIYGYFLWRKAWLQPGITANYGWGDRTQYKEREFIYKRLVANTISKRTLRNFLVTDTATIVATNRESIVDFTLAGSLRHDFYWLNIFSE